MFNTKPKWSNKWSGRPRAFSDIPLLCSNRTADFLLPRYPRKKTRAEKRVTGIQKLNTILGDDILRGKWIYITQSLMKKDGLTITWDHIINRAAHRFSNKQLKISYAGSINY